MERGITVYVFGNPDLPEDALPLKLLPQLQKKFPQISFALKDPNEEWDVPERLVVIDTVKDIVSVTVFPGLDVFTRAPRVTMHDYDALTQLRLLHKLGKLKEVVIIGVPPDMEENAALSAVTHELASLPLQ